MRRFGIFLLFVAPLAAQNHTALHDYGRLPLVFEPNLGQIDPAVKFLARTEGGTLFLTEREMVLARGGSAPVRMRLTGAEKPQTLRGLEPTGGISNYFIGNDPAKWRTGIPHYSRVEYKSVYAGVDVVYYGNPQKLEYDLVVAPGVDPKAIQVEYDGVESMRVDGNGDLVLRTADGELRQKRPRAYQEKAGAQVEVKVGYRLKADKRVEFALARYDAGRPLVIDPVLLYSTYLGGGNSDSGFAIAVDGSGNAYVTGITFSTDFPTTGPLQASNAGGGGDVFVTKLNAAGSARVYSTYLGGSSAEQGSAIAVDSSGNAYVTGQTMSTNFPTQLPIQAANGGGLDAFVTKINAAGSALVYSTYLGGSGSDGALGIAVDVSGAYLTGFTSSTNFPTASPLQPSSGGGGLDAFVTKINAAGSALTYSTYLGGNSIDQGQGIALDSSGDAYVTGQTNSSNFPTANALQATSGGGTDVFVTKINSAGSGLTYSTYLGGTAGDIGFGIAVDSSGNAYVTGYTGSANFPTTPSAMQTSFGGGLDAFVTKVSAAGSSVYSTYLGGAGADEGLGIGVDGVGNAYVTGLTQSANFPTTVPLQASLHGTQDAFVTEINAAGSSRVYSTYEGGSQNDQGSGIAVTGAGAAYVAGFTTSTDFPTMNPLQANNAGGTDAFVLSISGNSGLLAAGGVSPGAGSGFSQTFTFTFLDGAGFQSLGILDILFNDFLDGQHACYLAYVVQSNSLLLVDDNGDAGGPFAGGMVLNNTGSISNSQCTVNGVGSSAVGNGQTLTLTLNVTFHASFAGNRIFYLAARDNGTGNSGWQALGTWNVPGAAPVGPGVGGVSPGRSSTGAQTYSFTFTDTNGFADLNVLDIITNSFLDGISACYVAYVPTGATTGYLYLVNDAGNGQYVVGSPLLLSSGGTLQNSQCTINTAGSSASANGNTLTLNLAITFNTVGFAGNQVFYLAARNATTGNSGWQAVGSVTVP